MADPISMMAVASVATTAIGTGVSAFGAYEKGQGEASMYNYQARVAQINAGIAGEQAVAETAAGEVKAQTSGLQTAERVGMTRVGMAAGNLDIGSGSAKKVVESEEMVGQHEQAVIRNDAARRAYGYKVAEFGDIAQSNLDVAAGEGSKTAAKFDVATSILGGASSVSDKWVKFGQEGIAPFASA